MPSAARLRRIAAGSGLTALMTRLTEGGFAYQDITRDELLAQFLI